ncbi:MAG: anion permease [Sporomusaceae bacterium]|nr:anion permease [Sporomusaceae bacterium]
MSKKQLYGLITIGAGVLIWFLPVPAGLKPQAWQLFAIFTATILGFILQPIPIGAIAFISVGLAGLLKVISPAEALSGFGNTTIWLIVSAFLFAKGFIKTGLGRRIAYRIMRLIGDSSLKLGYAMVLSDLVIAPATPSNTARAGGILYPVVRSLCSAFDSEPGASSRKIGAYLMKTTFQGNCITSAMFITAVAPNSLVVALAAQTAGVHISWGTWAIAGIVPGLAGLLVTPYILYKLYPPEITRTPQAKALAGRELEKMGPMARGEKIVAGVFILALLLWATASLTKLDATMVAMSCVGIMLIGQAIEWKDVIEEKGAWDTLIWMGALMSLAGALNKLGMIAWFAKLVGGALTGVSWWVALGILLLAYMYSHYAFASLSAHVTAMYAAFLAVAVAAGAPPFLAAMSLGVISALYGGLTHYATGPAPIYFGSGYIPQGTWWKLGFILSISNLVIWIGLGGFWWKLLGLW